MHAYGMETINTILHYPGALIQLFLIIVAEIGHALRLNNLQRMITPKMILIGIGC